MSRVPNPVPGVSTVIVKDVRYDSSSPGFSNCEAAEQSAAEVALRELAESGGSGNVNQCISQPGVEEPLSSPKPKKARLRKKTFKKKFSGNRTNQIEVNNAGKCNPNVGTNDALVVASEQLGAETVLVNPQASCWAYSIADLLEMLVLKKYGDVRKLSPESIVRSARQSRSGRVFDGGFELIVYGDGKSSVQNIFDAIHDNGVKFEEDNGVNLRILYPLRTYDIVPRKERQIIHLLDEGHPLLVVLKVGSDFTGLRWENNWDIYQRNLLEKTQLQMLLLVGYGHDVVPYWKVKNTCGASWGRQGYGRIIRNLKIFPFYCVYKLVLRDVATVAELETPAPVH